MCKNVCNSYVIHNSYIHNSVQLTAEKSCTWCIHIYIFAVSWLQRDFKILGEVSWGYLFCTGSVVNVDESIVSIRLFMIYVTSKRGIF